MTIANLIMSRQQNLIRGRTILTLWRTGRVKRRWHCAISFGRVWNSKAEKAKHLTQTNSPSGKWGLITVMQLKIDVFFPSFCLSFFLSLFYFLFFSFILFSFIFFSFLFFFLFSFSFSFLFSLFFFFFSFLFFSLKHSTWSFLFFFFFYWKTARARLGRGRLDTFQNKSLANFIKEFSYNWSDLLESSF